MTVLGIDPGTTHSGYAVVYRDYGVVSAGKVENSELLALIVSENPSVCVVESLQSYGQSVGREVFETAYWIGEFRGRCRAAGIPCELIPRPEYARSLCGVQKVNDSVLRSALLRRFGGDKKGEPLYLLKGETDKRSAYALCVYHLDRTMFPRKL